jgi:hypothetical protein
MTLFDSTKHIDHHLEFYIDGTWIDMVLAGRVEENAGIVIVRGKSDGQERMNSTTLSATLKNMDGYLHNRNPRSPYYGKLGRNIPVRYYIVPGFPSGTMMADSDTFTRTALNWGSTAGGNAYAGWYAGLPVGTDWYTNGSVGIHSVPATAASRTSLLDTLEIGDVDVYATVNVQLASITGDRVEIGGIMLRCTDTPSSFYLCRAHINPDGSVVVNIYHEDIDLLAQATISGLTWTGQALRVRAQIVGNTISYKIWDASLAEPAVWGVIAVDTRIIIPNGIGFRSGVSAGNTNILPILFTWDDVVITPRITRFWGELSSIVVRTDKTGKYLFTQIECGDITRRLDDKNQPVISPLTRTIVADTAVVEYWPGNDSAENTSIAAYDSVKGAILSMNTGMNLGVVDGPASAPGKYIELKHAELFTLRTGKVILTSMPSPPWTIHFIAKALHGTITESIVSPISWNSGDTAWVSTLYQEVATNTCHWLVSVYDSVTTNSLGTTSDVTWTDGLWHHYSISVVQSGATLSAYMYFDGMLVGSDSDTATATGITDISLRNEPSTAIDSLSVGHITITTDPAATSAVALALAGHTGERAGTRFLRLAEENSIEARLLGTAVTTPVMGTQPTDTTLKIFYDIEDADGGFFSGIRNAPGVQFLPLYSLNGQSPKCALTYTNYELLGALTPTDDNALTCNDATITRTTITNDPGRRYVKLTGSLNIQEPINDPNGVGRYPVKKAHNLTTLIDCANRAGWRVHVGTYDASRYPRISIELSRTELVAVPALMTDVLLLDIGSVLTVSDPPTWLPPDIIYLMLLGYTETMGAFTHTITLNCEPYEPYRVGRYNGADVRYSSNSSTLAAALNTTATSFDVNYTGTRWVRTADDATSLPFDIKVGGERMTVTVVTGTTSPQTFTVTRSVNGIIKSHLINTSVDLFMPDFYGI